MAQCADDPSKLVKLIGQLRIDLRGQVDDPETFYGKPACAIMLRIPKPDDPDYNRILAAKWKHISEGLVRGEDDGCFSCRRRSATGKYFMSYRNSIHSLVS